MTAILPPRLDPGDPKHITPAAGVDERWFADALSAVQQLARRVVPGCDFAAVDLIEVNGSHPMAEGERSRPFEQAWGPNACDTLSVALLSGPMNEGGQLLGVLHLFSHDQPFGPGAAEPAALVARLTAALVVGRRHRRRPGPAASRYGTAGRNGS
ncbi:MAG: hypothetical protein M3179_08225 [Actinomycetota bacterium]|nr:hypothetical protein [Actinomycetota bacterium]